MKFTLKRCLLAAIVVAALLAAATPASAQFTYRPYGPVGPIPYGYPLGVPPPVYGPTISSSPYLSASGSGATLVTSPGGSTVQVGDPYTAPYSSNPYASFYNPAGGYLSGKADLTTARANSAVTYQRAYLVQEEVARSRLDTRRKLWEEARYERASLMNSEQYRQKGIQDELERARRDPPKNEIWSGQSLNSLFNYLVAQHGKGVKGPAVPINEDLLTHINLTTGKDGNASLLKRDIVWPPTLQRTEFEETRKTLDANLQTAVRLAKVGTVPTNVANDVQNDVRKMQDILKSKIDDLQPERYMEAKKYLGMLEESAKALSDPNVSDYFGDNGKRVAKGKTVEELIKNMTDKGLQFAPAAPGDDWAYTALYHAMASYDAGVTQVATPNK